VTLTNKAKAILSSRHQGSAGRADRLLHRFVIQPVGRKLKHPHLSDARQCTLPNHHLSAAAPCLRLTMRRRYTAGALSAGHVATQRRAPTYGGRPPAPRRRHLSRTGPLLEQWQESAVQVCTDRERGRGRHDRFPTDLGNAEERKALRRGAWTGARPIGTAEAGLRIRTDELRATALRGRHIASRSSIRCLSQILSGPPRAVVGLRDEPTDAIPALSSAERQPKRSKLALPAANHLKRQRRDSLGCITPLR
jgi:hypothetical protein